MRKPIRPIRLSPCGRTQKISLASRLPVTEERRADLERHLLALLQRPRRMRRQALERGKHEFVHRLEWDRFGHAR